MCKYASESNFLSLKLALKELNLWKDEWGKKYYYYSDKVQFFYNNQPKPLEY